MSPSVLFQVGEKLLIPVGVCVLGLIGNHVLEQDQKRRAYVDLLARREEADSNLRKDMFSKVIEQFVGKEGEALRAGPRSIPSRILYLELLVNNFHESIDLGPLLKQVYREVGGAYNAAERRKRLRKLAERVVEKELDSLKGVSCSKRELVDLDHLNKNGEISFEMSCQQPGLPRRRMKIQALSSFVSDWRAQAEVDIHLSVWPLEARGEPERVATFSVSPFDFPLIDNVRLADATRVAVAISRVDDASAYLTAIYFPGTRTSLKDRPYHDEVMHSLFNQPAAAHRKE